MAVSEWVFTVFLWSRELRKASDLLIRTGADRDGTSATHSSRARASRQSKKAISSAMRRGPLVADDGTFSVPFSHRQDLDVVALQHSRRHGGLVEALQKVSAEQFLVQPAFHTNLSDIFCSWKRQRGVKNSNKRPISVNVKWMLNWFFESS